MTYSNPEAYESFMGRWSAQLAPMFLRFVSLQEGQRVLDVGCGTGVLARAALAAGKSIEVTGVDPVESYIAFARSAGNSRASYQVATAESLPFPQGAFDTTLCLLVLQEFEDPDRAIDEMARVTRPMGKVAACQWDFRSGMPMMAMFWEAAALLDPEEVARRQVAARPLRNADVTDLAMRWARAGLRDVRTTSIEFGMPFRTFEDFWIPFTSGATPLSAFAAELNRNSSGELERLYRLRLRDMQRDGSFEFAARALAVCGHVAP